MAVLVRSDGNHRYLRTNGLQPGHVAGERSLMRDLEDVGADHAQVGLGIAFDVSRQQDSMPTGRSHEHDALVVRRLIPAERPPNLEEELPDRLPMTHCRRNDPNALIHRGGHQVGELGAATVPEDIDVEPAENRPETGDVIGMRVGGHDQVQARDPSISQVLQNQTGVGTAVAIGAAAAAGVAGAYCLASNRSAVPGDGANLGGLGFICDPEGNVLATTTPDTPFVTADIDLTAADRAKDTYPRYVPD